MNIGRCPRFVIGTSLIALTLSGCSEKSPTSPLLQQAVFNVLGGLEVGESVTLTGADASDLLISGAGTQYLVVPFHSSSQLSERLRVEIDVLPIGGPATSTAPLPAETFPAELSGWKMHEELLARHQREAEEILPSLRSRPEWNLQPGASSPPSPGDTLQINASAFGFCTDADYREGRVEAVTDHAIVVSDVENPSGGFTTPDFEQFGQLFDDLVNPVVTRYFSEPTDIDGNGRVIIFFTRAVNELTRNASQGYVAGFFYSRDLIPRASCPAGNAGEIFFVLAPDPNAEASPIAHERTAVFENSVGTIAHEYQHLINGSRRVHIHNAPSFEAVWLNEGLSHIAEELIFYAAAGLDSRSNLDFDAVTQSQATIDAMNLYGLQNLIRYGIFVSSTPNSSPTSRDALATRGATWSFLRYAADHQSRTPEQFFTSLADTPLVGFENLSQVLDGPPGEHFRRWGVSVYADDEVSGIDPGLEQPSWNFRELLPAIFGTPVFPLRPSRLVRGSNLQVSLVANGSAYYSVEPPDRGSLQLHINSGPDAPPDEFSITLLRVR